jgi:N-acetyltransferase 10
MRKKVDGRIQRIIENCQQANQRGVFVIIGDRARDVVVNIHFLTGKMGSKRAKKLLWCYNKELGFSSHKKKKMKEITANMKAGNYDSLSENPFDLFLTNNDIQFCYYRETQNVLGNTYSALILQDFEGLNPNVLCRTVETVQGGGLIFILVKSLTNLKQLYTMAMDVHKRFRTESHQDVEPRFNERFILSLCKAGNCLFVDDEMNLLTVSSQTENIAPVPVEFYFNPSKRSLMTWLRRHRS